MFFDHVCLFGYLVETVLVDYGEMVMQVLLSNSISWEANGECHIHTKASPSAPKPSSTHMENK